MKIVIDIPEDYYKAIKEIPVEQSTADMMIIRNGTPLDKIRAEIKKAVWEDVVVSLDGTDETRISRLDPDDVFKIIDKYRESGE